MTLDALLQADAAEVLADVGAEDALYLPAAGGTRAIKVLVRREPETLSADPRGTLRPVAVFARNDATTGVSSAEWTPKDHVRVAKTANGEHVVMRAAQMRNHNPGFVELELL